MTSRIRRPLRTSADRRPVGATPSRTARAWAWRDEMRSVSACNLLSGVWIVAAPWALDYSSQGALLNSVLLGGLIALIALVRVAGAYSASWLSWINALAGGWLAVSAFALPLSGIAQWNSLVFGITVFGLACWSARVSERGNAG